MFLTRLCLFALLLTAPLLRANRAILTYAAPNNGLHPMPHQPASHGR